MLNPTNYVANIKTIHVLTKANVEIRDGSIRKDF